MHRRKGCAIAQILRIRCTGPNHEPRSAWPLHDMSSEIEPQSTRGRRGLVLVVDDDARTARRLAMMLREDGFDAEVAIDGAGAIGRLTRTPAPDFLVTDLRMPHADGSSVVQFARSRQPNLPVIVVTGHPNMAQALASLEPSVLVMSKPVVYEDLLQRLMASSVTPAAAT